MSVARAAFVNILRNYASASQKDLLLRGQYSYLSCLKRAFASVPLEYNDRDPAPIFFSPNVQKLMKYVTRPEIEKVFRKRNNKGDGKLETPEYKFLTDAELQEELVKAQAKADYLLQIPPVVKVYDNSEPEVLSFDPALVGHDNSKYIFTDITYGLKGSERFVTVREPDGTLHVADHDTRKKCLQVYFPMNGRSLLESPVFTDESLLNDLLERKEYEFILDRACIQYEPDEAKFQTITNRVYLHIDDNKDYNLLRSTRHFGSMAFFFAWNNMIDNLVLEMLQYGMIREVVTLINLQRTIHPEMVPVDDSKPLAEEILQRVRPITDTSKYEETPADLELDEKCIECVDKYVRNNSSKKALQELALQAYQDVVRNKISMQSSIKTAHGI